MAVLQENKSQLQFPGTAPCGDGADNSFSSTACSLTLYKPKNRILCKFPNLQLKKKKKGGSPITVKCPCIETTFSYRLDRIKDISVLSDLTSA